jgi:hypothetical protein
MRVEELTTDELKRFIGNAVEQKLEELLGDPDWNLELRVGEAKTTPFTRPNSSDRRAH